MIMYVELGYKQCLFNICVVVNLINQVDFIYFMYRVEETVSILRRRYESNTLIFVNLLGDVMALISHVEIL